MINREQLERLYEKNLEVLLNNKISELGYPEDSTCKLFRFIAGIFRQIPPELVTWKFNVILPVGTWDFTNKEINNICMNLDNKCCILPKNNTSFLEKICARFTFYHHVFGIST